MTLTLETNLLQIKHMMEAPILECSMRVNYESRTIPRAGIHGHTEMMSRTKGKIAKTKESTNSIIIPQRKRAYRFCLPMKSLQP